MTLSPGSSSARNAAMLALAPGVRLHVGVLGAEQLAEPVAGEHLGLVDHEVAAVVALRRVALGVLVGEHRALGGEHRGRGEVLRRDELDRWCSGARVSRRMMSAISGSVAASALGWCGHVGHFPVLDGGDLVDAALVAATLERGGEPDPQDLVGEALAHHPGADRQHVGVVVPTRVLGRCRGRCRARRAPPSPCWPTAARPGRSRRARCPARPGRRPPPGPPRSSRSGSRPAPRSRCRGRRPRGRPPSGRR